MIQPAQQDDTFLADVVSAGDDRLHLWWLGQSGFLVKWNSRHLLLDPYLSDSLTEKYAATDKPHARMTGRVVAPARLGFVDVVTSSHNHTDHLDAPTLLPMFDANPGLKLVLPEANRTFAAERLGMNGESFVGLDERESATVCGFEFHGIPAAHDTIERDEQGRCKFMGFVIRCGPWTIYHSGDTLLHDALADRLRAFSIDVALLPINGNVPERRVAGNLDGREAAELAKEIGAGLAVPCHFEMFEFNTATPDRFIATCKELGQPYRVLRAGERLTLQE